MEDRCPGSDDSLDMMVGKLGDDALACYPKTLALVELVGKLAPDLEIWIVDGLVTAIGDPTNYDGNGRSYVNRVLENDARTALIVAHEVGHYTTATNGQRGFENYGLTRDPRDSSPEELAREQRATDEQLFIYAEAFGTREAAKDFAEHWTASMPSGHAWATLASLEASPSKARPIQ